VPVPDREWPFVVDVTLEFDRRTGVHIAVSRDILPDVLLCNPGFGKALIPAFALCVAPLACAQPTSPDSGKWRYEAAPHIWAAGTDLSTRLGASVPVANVNGSASGDISSSTHAGVMGTFEARRDRWGVLLDMWRLKVSNDSKPVLGGALGNASLKTTQGVIELAGAYRVWNGQTTPIDAVAGARYSYLKADLNLSPSLSIPAGARLTESVEWPDVFLGVRVAHALSDKWRLVGYADIGAGATKKSWQALAGANYAFSKNMSAKFGYRIFNMDFERSYFISDVRTDFRLNMKTSGVYAGLGFKF
jgi:opacity protein-like surface antigen